MTFAAFCRDLFVLASACRLPHGPERGRAWETSVFDYITRRLTATESIPGGYRFCGYASVSGLAHQLDSTCGLGEAIVLAEWKAHRGRIPKNDLLRFKAASDDYLVGLGRAVPRRPVFRLFGGPGESSDELRAYAAQHGITIISRRHWPIPMLVSDRFIWPTTPTQGPRADERRLLGWAARPWQRVMTAQPGGAFLVNPPASAAMIHALLRLQAHWSDRLWDAVDEEPRRFSGLIERIVGQAA
jgi:hypothetical protein